MGLFVFLRRPSQATGPPEKSIQPRNLPQNTLPRGLPTTTHAWTPPKQKIAPLSPTRVMRGEYSAQVLPSMGVSSGSARRRSCAFCSLSPRAGRGKAARLSLKLAPLGAAQGRATTSVAGGVTPAAGRRFFTRRPERDDGLRKPS